MQDKEELIKTVAFLLLTKTCKEKAIFADNDGYSLPGYELSRFTIDNYFIAQNHKLIDDVLLFMEQNNLMDICWLPTGDLDDTLMRDGNDCYLKIKQAGLTFICDNNTLTHLRERGLYEILKNYN